MQSRSSHSTLSPDLPSIDDLSRKNTAEQRYAVLSVAAVDFAQLIEAAGAQDVLDAIARYFKVSNENLHDIIDRSSPFFLRAYQDWMDRRGGIQQLNDLVYSGGPQQFAERPGLVTASLTQQEGRALLTNLFPNDEAVDNVTKEVASSLRIRLETIRGLMPHLAALFVGVLCKSIAQ